VIDYVENHILLNSPRYQVCARTCCIDTDIFTRVGFRAQWDQGFLVETRLRGIDGTQVFTACISVVIVTLIGVGFRTKVSKPATNVSPGDVLTFPKDDYVRVIRIDGLGTRRGPAPEAQALYEDLDPPKPREKNTVAHNPKFEGQGRPTKKDRRALDLSRLRTLD